MRLIKAAPGWQNCLLEGSNQIEDSHCRSLKTEEKQRPPVADSFPDKHLPGCVLQTPSQTTKPELSSKGRTALEPTLLSHTIALTHNIAEWTLTHSNATHKKKEKKHLDKVIGPH